MVSLKDYNRQIIWLDYFDSSLSRSQGRRVPKNRTIKNPDLSNLIRAAERLDLKPEGQHAKHPKRFSIQSGYVSIEKIGQKSSVIQKIAKILPIVKGETKNKK